MKLSPLQLARYQYNPKLPGMLRNGISEICVKNGEATESVADQEKIKALFPNTYGKNEITFQKGQNTSEAKKQAVGHHIGLAEVAFDDKLVILDGVLGDLIVVQAVVLSLASRIDDAFRNIHALSAVVFQLVAVNHNGERLTCLHKGSLEVDGESLLTQQSDTHVGS